MAKRKPATKRRAVKRPSNKRWLRAASKGAAHRTSIKRRPPKKLARHVAKWRKPKKNGRGNPAMAAKAMYEKFHGKPSTKHVDYKVAQHFHAELAELGELVSLTVELPEWIGHDVELRPKGVSLACSEDGGQMYFLGGDQRLNLNKLGLAETLPKDHVVIGNLLQIVYLTEKDFDDFKPYEYQHEMGEEGGELPLLCYDVRSELMYLAGGSYQCLRPGIVN